METCHEEVEEMDIIGCSSNFNNGWVGGTNTGGIVSGGNSSPVQNLSGSPGAPLTGNTITTNCGISTSSLSSTYQQQDICGSPVAGSIHKTCGVRLGSRKHSITPSLKQIQQILTREVRKFVRLCLKCTPIQS